MSNLVLATRNAHKLAEICALLADEFVVRTLADFPSPPDLPETASSFAGNATQKALTLAQWLGNLPESEFPRPVGAGCLVVADDSGLEVDALDGAPGVQSARYASADGGNANDADNNARLLRELENLPPEKHTARFICTIAVAEVVCREDTPEAHLFEGMCEGRVITGLRGENGFGYDPMFIPEGHEQTFGELDAEIKNGISHRARALAKLAVWLRDAGLQPL